MAVIDHKKLALIHIVKRELNLSEQEYRDILHRAAGVQSARELTEETFRKLMRFFVRSGHYRLNRRGLTIKQKLYIGYLASQLHWEQSHLDNFIAKYYHQRGIDALSRKEAIKVIESLKNIRQHQAERRA